MHLWTAVRVHFKINLIKHGPFTRLFVPMFTVPYFFKYYIYICILNDCCLAIISLRNTATSTRNTEMRFSSISLKVDRPSDYIGQKNSMKYQKTYLALVITDEMTTKQWRNAHWLGLVKKLKATNS